MSDAPRWAEVCEQEKSIGLDASSACHPLQVPPASPIDNFYDYTSSLIPLGDETALRTNAVLGRTLLLGLVSGTEHYFRAVISGLVRVCPLARRHASTQPISFGALEYYSKDDLGLALLENISLATAGEVKTQTKRLVNIDISKDPSVTAAFVEYDKLCQLRHATVHARGDLGHQNLQELGIKNVRGRMGVRIELGVFHVAVAISQNVVRGYNRFLYRKTVERWIADKLLAGRWEVDKQRFPQLFSLFHSRRDLCGYKNAYLAYLSLSRIVTKTLTAPLGG